MSRSGRGGGRGRGGRKTGPDLSWDDEINTLDEKKPDQLFPEITIPTPRPASKTEMAVVEQFLQLRELMRNGPLYTDLDPTSFLDENGKVNHRAGFDPFNGMEKYSTRNEKPKRSMPDLSGQEYSLELFPQELWRFLDPKKTHPLWETVAGPPKKKRKRAIVPSDNEASDDSDAVLVPSKRKRTAPKTKDDPTKVRGQKAGLEPEDDIPDIEQDDDDGEGEDDALEDTDFSESDQGGDDYDAEGMFDNGEGDDFDDGGFGEGDGGYYE